jgi:phosphate transport system substrate-binding protein
VVTTALPGGEQDDFFKARKLEAESVPVCTDAIAVVVNKACRTTGLSRASLKYLLQNETDRPQGDWSAIIAGAESGTARTLVDSLQLDPALLRARAGVDVPAVIASVEADSSVLGLVPFVSISDLDNPDMRALRDRVKLLPIARSDTCKAFLPTQGTLADGSYPLRRQVYMVLTEAKSGLGTGFVSFVANHKGQRILLKSGLAPHKVPAREVEIVHQ